MNPGGGGATKSHHMILLPPSPALGMVNLHKFDHLGSYLCVREHVHAFHACVCVYASCSPGCPQALYVTVVV